MDAIWSIIELCVPILDCVKSMVDGTRLDLISICLIVSSPCRKNTTLLLCCCAFFDAKQRVRTKPN